MEKYFHFVDNNSLNDDYKKTAKTQPIKKQSSRGVIRKRCSEKFHKIQRKTPVPGVSFLITLLAWGLQLIKKETLAQTFSCKCCEISQNTFSYKAPVVAASAHSWLLIKNILVKCIFRNMISVSLSHYFCERAVVVKAVYILNKRGRFGLKSFVLCEAKTGYLSKSVLWTRR